MEPASRLLITAKLLQRSGAEATTVVRREGARCVGASPRTAEQF